MPRGFTAGSQPVCSPSRNSGEGKASLRLASGPGGVAPTSKLRHHLAAAAGLASALLSPVVSHGDASSPATSTYDSPFAYCAAVGDIDRPDGRYSGKPVPDAIARGLQRSFDAPADASLEAFVRGTTWRCMGGKVWACNVGANLPCGERADTSRDPDVATSAYCRENHDTDFVPAYVTGRATVFAWRCQGGRPVIVRQVEDADARGFLTGIWYQIEPGP